MRSDFSKPTQRVKNIKGGLKSRLRLGRTVSKVFKSVVGQKKRLGHIGKSATKRPARPGIKRSQAWKTRFMKKKRSQMRRAKQY